jgi:hypothetical protein
MKSLKKCPFLNLKEDCKGLECAIFIPTNGPQDTRYGKCAITVTAEKDMRDSDKTQPLNFH